MNTIICPTCHASTADVYPDNVAIGIQGRKCEHCGTVFFRHPELKSNEVLIINVKDNEDWESKLPSFIESVRRGEVAYTTGGKEIVKDMKPLFAILKK